MRGERKMVLLAALVVISAKKFQGKPGRIYTAESKTIIINSTWTFVKFLSYARVFIFLS